MRVEIDGIPITGLDARWETMVNISPSYMAVNDEVKVILTGTVLPETSVESGKSYKFTGNIQVSALFSCDKCLKDIAFKRMVDICEDFSNRDTDEWPLNGDTIDFTEAILAGTMLALPMKILCKDDCLGLCPTCGADLNEGICGCEKPLDSRFAALSSFFKEE